MGEKRAGPGRPHGSGVGCAAEPQNNHRRSDCLRGVLYGGLGNLPGQRRERRGSGPRAPNETVPAHRRRRASCGVGLRHGGAAHCGIGGGIAAGIQRPQPCHCDGNLHCVAAGLLLRVEASASDRHCAGVLGVHAARYGWRCCRRHHAVPVVSLGRGVRLPVYGIG